MDKIYLVKVKNDEEFCTLKFMLYAREFENNGAYYVKKPIIINFKEKNFNNVENENVEEIENKFKIKMLSLKEFKTSITQKNTLEK